MSIPDALVRRVLEGRACGTVHPEAGNELHRWFRLAVPTANKKKFLAHARTGDPVFIEYGALRVVECWGDDVPHGKTTDFFGAVKATPDETVVFSGSNGRTSRPATPA